MRSRLLCFHDLRKCCQYLLLFQGLWCRAGELFLGTVEPSLVDPGQGVICLHTSRAMGFRVGSGVAVDNAVGIPDGVQWMRVPEWSIGPLIAIALDYG